MAISGKETITVGVENQATGSDDLYTAFRKVVTNFDTLFDSASPYLEFIPGTGIATIAAGNTVTILNTGVTKLTAGTGITLNGSNGNIIISVSGSGSGTVAGVTNVNVTSSTLTVSGAPIISQGNISIELPSFPTTGDFAPGEYVAPTLTVDRYGRITKISPVSSAGTVTSIALSAGDGIAVTGSPITTSGTIVVRNTGVTKVNAGPGINLSGSTGDITISAKNPTYGTVTRLDVTSSTLVVTGSPITSTGTINVELPSTVTYTKVTAGNVVSTGPMSATTTITGGNLVSSGNLTVTGNATAGNVSATLFTGNVLGNLNGTIGNTTRNTGNFTAIDATGNISTTANLSAGNLSVTTLIKTTGTANINNLTVTGNITVDQKITATGNVQGGNVLSGGIVYGASYIQAGQGGSLVYVPSGHIVIGTALPIQNILEGSIAIDQANGRLGVFYAGSWHYVNLSA
jgi:hypothetical protein